MKVKDLLEGMNNRAMDSLFQDGIRKLYDEKDYGDTEPDCRAGYEHLLPLLTEEQKMSLNRWSLHTSSGATMLPCTVSNADCLVPSGSTLVHPRHRTVGSRIWSAMIC